MTKYFINCTNLDDLKKAYKAAALKVHPGIVCELSIAKGKWER